MLPARDEGIAALRLAGLAGAKAAADLPRWLGLKVGEAIARNSGYDLAGSYLWSGLFFPVSNGWIGVRVAVSAVALVPTVRFLRSLTGWKPVIRYGSSDLSFPAEECS